MFLRCFLIHRYLFICFSFLLLISTIVVSGLYQWFLTVPYESSYRHLGPQEPLGHLIEQIEEGSTPDILPINEFSSAYLIDNKQKCEKGDSETIRLLFLVKSALDHFYARQIIRQSWGFEHRFSDVNIRTLFLLGSRPDEPHFQVRINKENKLHKDIIQGDFYDSYYNNTIKTMMGLNWSFHNCAKAKYIFFVDDDYYVSTRNVLRFLRDPKNYPQYLETFVASSANEYQENLWAGYIFPSSYPKRLITSKWYVSLEEYPYSRYPPYLTAGAHVISQRSLKSIYYASIFTKPFKFDDVFLGMCAKKANIKLFHHKEFWFQRKPYSIESYKYVIASHGFDDPDEMNKIWDEQRSVGNA